MVFAFRAKSGERGRCAMQKRQDGEKMEGVGQARQEDGRCLATELEKRGTGPARITWSRSTAVQTSSLEASPLWPSQLVSRDVVDVGVGEVVSDVLSIHVAPLTTRSVLSVENC